MARKIIILLIIMVLPFGFVQAQTTNNATDFTYQGYLELNGSPVNANCNFTFTLFNALNSGTQIGAMQTVNSVTVTEGVFSVQLDFGAGVFNGQDRWLQIAVNNCAGGGTFTPLAPRQTITPAAYALYSTTAWNLGGNSNTTPGPNFIGTIDNQALEFRVNNLRILRLEPNSFGPNVIAGVNGNNVTAGVAGATISGGGNGIDPNSITDNFSTIGGGLSNQAGNNNMSFTDSFYATVGGGFNNGASNIASTVSGGETNNATASYTTISGGGNNTAGGGTSTIAGGYSNNVSGFAGVIGGGSNNQNTGLFGTIAGGGNLNPGDGNRVTDDYGTVGGGTDNQAGDALGTTTDNQYATVAGGWLNVASGGSSAIGGGAANTADGTDSVVPGGSNNSATGDHSFAAGRRAKANHRGAFVWADSTDADFNSSAMNEFAVRATGGVRFVTSGGTGCSLAGSGGTWTCTSDRNAKDAFMEIDSRQILEAVADMPITSWEYLDTNVRHIGPVAQDFYTAFGIGESETTISMVDADGVALAAIQGLNLKLQEEVRMLKTIIGVIAVVLALNFGISVRNKAKA